MPDPIRLAIVDDQELFLDSITALFAGADPGIEVAWSARSGEEALEMVRQDAPDVVLLDYFFKNSKLNGSDISRQLLETNRDIAILVLSVSCDLAIIREALGAGAIGYASKEINKAELLNAIRTVARRQYFLDQRALETVIGSWGRKRPLSVLTRRELEVAVPYARGLQIREIAAELFISEDTVESHIKNIRSKTGASNRYKVGEYLKEHGLEE
jgi:DNA-binding NarL/FixJ family response regulator